VRSELACLEEKARQSKVALDEEKASNAKWLSWERYASGKNLDVFQIRKTLEMTDSILLLQIARL
jgi:hypothetical protein